MWIWSIVVTPRFLNIINTINGEMSREVIVQKQCGKLSEKCYHDEGYVP